MSDGSMSEWEELRRQIAIAGIVKEETTKKGVAGAVVTVTSMPKEFHAQVEAKRRLAPDKRPDQAVTAEDGSFFFVELPQGSYELMAAVRSGEKVKTGMGKGKVVKDSEGNIKMASISIVLKP
jgi:hypothetical protein